MSQDINLLGAGARSSRRPPNAVHAAVLAAAIVAAGLAASAWMGGRLAAGDTRVTAANQAIDDLVLSLEERSQFLAQRNADPVLLAELTRLEREAADKARVLDLLSGETLGNTEGFSAHLAALGRRHPEGLWLEDVRIGEGGRRMLLRGKALHAGLIPRLLENLKGEAAFAGTAFQSFEMAGEPVRFALATGCEQAEDAEPCFADADVRYAPGEAVAAFGGEAAIAGAERETETDSGDNEDAAP